MTTEDRFEAIVAQLTEEESRLSQRRAQLSTDLQSVESDLRRAQAALAALVNESSSAAPKKKRERPLGPTRKQITSLVAEVLQDLGALDEDRLRAEVASRLKDKRISQVGFAARFREALGDHRFDESPHGWRLMAREELGDFEAVSH